MTREGTMSMTMEKIRSAWQRKGVVGHCPVCHRRDWQDMGEVALHQEGGELAVAAAHCGHCGFLMLATVEEGPAA